MKKDECWLAPALAGQSGCGLVLFGLVWGDYPGALS